MKIILLPILFLCFLLQSCSRLDLAVQFSGNYIVNKTDNYFDLTKEQKKWLKENFDNDFLKVQKNIFPQIAGELLKIADVINSKRPIDNTMVSVTYERVKNLFYDSLRLFSGNAVIFADHLTPKQIVYFQKEFDIKMGDLKDEESSKDSYKKMKKQFDTWMGSVTSAQKDELEKFNFLNPPMTSEIISNRQFLAHEFVKSYPDKIARKNFVEKLTIHLDKSYEEKFSKAYRDRYNKVLALTASILNKMTDDQRKTMVETLRDRANQLMKISKN